MRRCGPLRHDFFEEEAARGQAGSILVMISQRLAERSVLFKFVFPQNRSVYKL